MSLELDKMLNFVEEPPVNLRQVMNFLQRITATERFGDQEQSLIVRFDQAFIQRLGIDFFRAF
ncbi:hypothetical protein D3C78_725370 [compost metagenome]